jgi:flagellar operon protein (TIGR03826 family)
VNLVYCPRCNKLFAKGFREICNNCHNELEKDYERCIEYLRLHKGINIQQLSDETEIGIGQITKWLREGRISLFNAPNMSYPCEVCGILIRESNMCDSCRARLQRDVKDAKSKPSSTAQDFRGSGAYQISDRNKHRN